MGRRSYREKVFKLLFRAAFLDGTGMEEQYRFFEEEELEKKLAELPEDEEEREARIHAVKQSCDEVIGTVRRVVERLPELDAGLDQRMDDWTTERIGRVELTLLRLALYEIRYEEDVSTAVAINEAVELAKSFGPERSPEFINGVLAKFA